jgi:hypothetical protein
MLQAVERQPTESTISLEDRTPANHQKEIFVRILIYLINFHCIINLEFI